MDVQNTGAHELGHNLMLADLTGSTEREFTMYVYTYTGETKKRSLEYDDIDGIRYLYNYQNVRLDEFTAKPHDGNVVVAWKAAVEVDHAGY
ncbi:MAG TPA: matrixin family metalloprotease, partial [bacterium]|nr:matrixin family metalloprotease [bacterium]